MNYLNNLRKLVNSLSPAFLSNVIKKYRIKYHFHQNINLNPSNPFQKTVLISYITSPLEGVVSNFSTHTNINECRAIINIFQDLGYSLDLVHCLDNKHNSEILKKKYDIVFGFGEPFYNAALQNPDAIKIVYLTESHPDFSLKNELERIEYFYQRHHKRTLPRRSGKHLSTKEIAIADFGILIGNSVTSQSYNFPQGTLFTLEPTGLINKNYVYRMRDLSESRKNFIWFGSYGAIHKGLDILIDAFSELPDYHLYICGLPRDEKKLFDINKKNIHDLGFVHVDLQPFIRLADSCSYVILPSCAEGMATSVLTCMNHGLIPVITRECGIDLQDWGTLIDNYHVEAIREKIKFCANQDLRLLERYHREIYEYSQNRFDIPRFSQNFKRTLKKIINDKSTVK
jgi:glycosyltransferase involved in cell wall biosynthesis